MNFYIMNQSTPVSATNINMLRDPNVYLLKKFRRKELSNSIPGEVIDSNRREEHKMVAKEEI